ncbi:MAG: hypothetical protein ACRDHY_16970, partial [Anaerolineales bacterium]
VVGADGGVTREAAVFEVQDVPAAAVRLHAVEAAVAPVTLDPQDLNTSTYRYYRQRSIAALRRVGEDRYRTSVGRKIDLRAVVAPAGFTPLVEWHVRGEHKVRQAMVGSPAVLTFSEPGVYSVWVGIGPDARRIVFEIYRTLITSHENGRDVIPDGVPVTFTAETDPPGFEEDITWLASTSYGSAEPIVGQGPSFTVRFQNTFGRRWAALHQVQWLGVRADNAIFGQDRKKSVVCDPTDYEGDRPSVSEFYQADVSAYWANHGLPPLSRLTNQMESLALEPLSAFGGLIDFFRETSFLRALASGEISPEFKERLNALQPPANSTWEALVRTIGSYVSELDAISGDPGKQGRVDEIHSLFGSVFRRAFDLDEIHVLVPPPIKDFVPSPTECITELVCRAGFESFSADLTSTPTDDNDTSTSTKWTAVSGVPWKTTYNASCVAQAVGPSGAVLGLLEDSVTCKGWNDLSRELGAKPGKAGAGMSSVCDWYKGKGYCCTQARDGTAESACQEAKKALERGCDVLFHYQSIDDMKAHLEKVQSIEIDTADSKKCKATTLSWGQKATVDYERGKYRNKSDGLRYRKTDEPKSYLEGEGKAMIVYYCKC